MKVVLITAILLALLALTDAIRCRLCERAAYLDECTAFEICDADEECYIEEFVTDQFTILYNGGCRSKSVCNNTILSGKRDEVVSCSRCCSSNECNSQLCGIKSKTFAFKPPPLLECLTCNNATNIGNCKRVDICNINQYCYMDEILTSQLRPVYYSGCRDRDMCVHGDKSSIPPGGIRTCSRCCSSSGCNSHLCGLKSVLPVLKCRACNKVSSLSQCTGYTACSKIEECFMEEITTGQNKTVYTGGCRESYTCRKMDGWTSRRGLDLVTCADCCATSECNKNLCGTNTSQHNTASTAGQKCRFCDEADSLDNCTRMVQCSVFESCYMEEFITNQLTVVYNGGCRPKPDCKSIHGRSLAEDVLTSCSRCCDNGDDCNRHICGIKAQLVGRDTGMTCHTCSGVTDISQCQSVGSCSSDQVCYSETIRVNQEIRHSATCMDKKTCIRKTQDALWKMRKCRQSEVISSECDEHGLRDPDTCVACCGEPMCNKDTCQNILDRLYNAWENNALDFPTLKLKRLRLD